MFTSFLLTLVFFESIAFYSLSKHNQTNKTKWLVMAMLIYGLIVVTMLDKCMKANGGGIGKVNFTWNCCSTIMAFLVGTFLFGEEISRRQWIGIGVSIVGLWMILK
jgi:multidrug transporter EmrE-like cation transporter